MVESMIRYSKSGSSDIASKILDQTRLMLHRLKRRNTLFQSPNASGRSRQGEPVRTIHSTPSTNIRLSRPVEPFWSGRPMISGKVCLWDEPKAQILKKIGRHLIVIQNGEEDGGLI